MTRCLQAVPGSTSSAEMSGAEVNDAEEKEEKEEKSEIYSHNMTEAMGAGESRYHAIPL